MRHRGLAIYSFTHFWVDFSCALLLFGRVAGEGNPWMAFLLYNFFAFAVQMPVGLLFDHLGGATYKHAAVLGCALTALAWGFGGLPAAIIAGLGNALFHVGGGLYSLNSSDGCGPLGIFVSPGAMGIYLGALPAVQAAVPPLSVIAGLILLGFAILRWGEGVPCASFNPAPKGGGNALVPLLALFSVVLLRSLVGVTFAFPWKGDLGLLLAFATALGKGAGGLLADRCGRRRIVFCSLVIAAGCFLFSDVAPLGLLAVFTFNMTMPLTLRGAADILKGAKGLAFGLLTFALFLGVLPPLVGTPLATGRGVLYAAGGMASLWLMYVGLGEGERRG